MTVLQDYGMAMVYLVQKFDKYTQMSDFFFFFIGGGGGGGTMDTVTQRTGMAWVYCDSFTDFRDIE